MTVRPTAGLASAVPQVDKGPTSNGPRSLQAWPGQSMLSFGRSTQSLQLDNVMPEGAIPLSIQCGRMRCSQTLRWHCIPCKPKLPMTPITQRIPCCLNCVYRAGDRSYLCRSGDDRAADLGMIIPLMERANEMPIAHNGPPLPSAAGDHYQG